MIGKGTFLRSAALICIAVSLFLTACGEVPQGITESTASPVPISASPKPESTGDRENAPASPAPNMDLTPETGVNSGGENKSAETVRVTLHYVTDEGYVLPVSERIEKQDGIARACLTKLIASDENENALKALGLSAPIPKGTQIGLSIDSGVATVNLSGMPDLESRERENALFASIVNTLTQFPSVQVVTVYINGSSAETANGSALPKNMRTVALNVEDEAIETGAGDGLTALELYFPNGSGSIFVPVTRYVRGRSGLGAAITQLAEGTSLKGLRACFPENTLILGAAVENGVLSVNCSSDFMRVSEMAGAYSLAMQSVLLTARNFGSIDEIRFLVNGVPFEPQS